MAKHRRAKHDRHANIEALTVSGVHLIVNMIVPTPSGAGRHRAPEKD